MFEEQKLSRYSSSLTEILKYKQEALSYYENLISLQKLQKKATFRLFINMPLLFTLRSLLNEMSP